MRYWRKLEGAEVLFVVGQARFGCADHVVDVVEVSGGVVDLDRNRIGGAGVHSRLTS